MSNSEYIDANSDMYTPHDKSAQVCKRSNMWKLITRKGPKSPT
jgi:hypothetical protein